MADLLPEQQARRNIDAQLTAAGWCIQSMAELNLGASLGVAVREFPVTGGEADYILFVDRKAAGVVEAKPEGTTLSGVAEQSERYGLNFPADIPPRRTPAQVRIRIDRRRNEPPRQPRSAAPLAPRLHLPQARDAPQARAGRANAPRRAGPPQPGYWRQGPSGAEGACRRRRPAGDQQQAARRHRPRRADRQGEGQIRHARADAGWASDVSFPSVNGSGRRDEG